MATTSVLVLTMAILLTRAVKSDQELETGGKEGQQGAKSNVDIAEFYARTALIWILGFGKSSHPCMLDVVEQTTATSTSFWRYRWEKPSFQKNYLNGEFTEQDSLGKFNSMLVSSKEPNTRRQSHTGSWNGSEVMLCESSNRKCAVFSSTYSERPSNLPVETRKQRRATSAIVRAR
ncbi:uncharacterized protein [Dermacentor albipictus]|uniref:uncharacterized protein isoform X3 n=1 Tax=Dermacentor albipictus TaxID=60249 RepID=UPI0031FE4235